jgi:hypothetical protein
MAALYVPALVVHVVVAVLGLGQLAATGIVAGSLRRHGLTAATSPLRQLVLLSGISLAILLVTGVIMDVAAGGAFHAQWWFRGSALLLIATGATHARTRRAVRVALVEQHAPRALRSVERLSYAMCGLVATITVLMELKPF